MLFKTLSSTYEIDHPSKKIRRLSGANAPTARQAPDGVWKEFVDITLPKVGGPVLIVWEYAEKNILRSTLTSDVQEIIEETVC